MMIELSYFFWTKPGLKLICRLGKNNVKLLMMIMRMMLRFLVMFLMRYSVVLSRMNGYVDRGRSGGEGRQLLLLSTGGVQLKLEVSSGSLDQHSLQNMRINSLQKDRISQDCLQQCRIYAGNVVFIYSVTGLIWGGELIDRWRRKLWVSNPK